MYSANCYFFPDYSSNSGLGHFYRCLKYACLIKNKKKFFLYKKKFKPNLIKILNKKKIKLVKVNKKLFKYIKKVNDKNILTLDTYKKNIFSKEVRAFEKIILISDKKPLVINPDVIIDHTFKRNKKFYKEEKKKNIKCLVGIDYFPFKKEKNRYLKRDKILVNFGGVFDKNLINKSLKILNKISLQKNIIIISRYYSKKFIPKNCKNLDVKIVKQRDQLNDIYKKTFLSFGSCGISIYEKLFYKVPSICTSVARNQFNNYLNFSKFKFIIKLKDAQILESTELLKNIKTLKKRLKKFGKFVDKKKIYNIIKLYETKY
tara:strand:+ start:1806 stop:2756 length:951 start_codon:yes stop_codon:yes gene_type:complete